MDFGNCICVSTNGQCDEKFSDFYENQWASDANTYSLKLKKRLKHKPKKEMIDQQKDSKFWFIFDSLSGSTQFYWTLTIKLSYFMKYQSNKHCGFILFTLTKLDTKVCLIEIKCKVLSVASTYFSLTNCTWVTNKQHTSIYI